MPSIMLDIFFQRVLTAEYVDACKVDDVESLKQRGLDVADVSLPCEEKKKERKLHSIKSFCL